jgi:hypothetical protein
MSEKDLKRKLLIASSSYSTHGDYTLDEWFEAQDLRRNNSDFKKKYRALTGKK